MITEFRLFESYNEIKSICKEWGIKNWRLDPETGRVNVRGDVYFSECKIKKIPVSFGVVEGNFDCRFNLLTSLYNSPERVGGNFWCNNNKLTSLEHGPVSVNGEFSCGYNKLTSLKDSPNSVGGDFLCSYNKLTSLEGSPNSIGGSFYCNGNEIMDFKIPEYSLNDNVTFDCEDNPIEEIYILFNTPKCIDIINEYGVVGGDKISKIKLEEVFLELDMEIPKKFRFRHWKLVN